MVNRNTSNIDNDILLKSKLKNVLDQLFTSTKTEQLKRDKQELALFVSFDIVNSSKYKTSNYQTWFIVLSAIFEKIKTVFKENIPNSVMWRTIGDEIIFVLNINTLSQLQESISMTFKILTDLSQMIKRGEIYNNILNEDEIDIIRQRNLLSLKAAAWIAIVANDAQRNVPNVKYITYSKDNSMPFYEFQGNDIDAGFRISKNTRDKRLVLSFELAYLIAENSHLAINTYIISFLRLKGIWDNRLYPVIWYHDEKIAKTSLENSFYYDEDSSDELVKSFFEHRNQKNKNEIFGNGFSNLEKIALDCNLDFKINKLKKCITNNSNNKNKIIDASNLEKIHCVAVCKNQQNKILIAKHSANTNYYPNKWDFGCSIITSGLTFEEALVRDYKKFFNIDINVLTPFKTYNFLNKNNELILGIRFLATITDDTNIKCSDQYSDYKYIDLSTFDNIPKADYIDYDDFKKIINYILSNNSYPIDKSIDIENTTSSTKKKLGNSEIKVLDSIKHKKEVTRSELQILTNLSKTTIIKSLKSLTEKNIIRRTKNSSDRKPTYELLE